MQFSHFQVQLYPKLHEKACNYLLIICDSTWEKGPSHAFLQNRVIATVTKSSL